MRRALRPALWCAALSLLWGGAAGADGPGALDLLRRQGDVFVGRVAEVADAELAGARHRWELVEIDVTCSLKGRIAEGRRRFLVRASGPAPVPSLEVALHDRGVWFVMHRRELPPKLYWRVADQEVPRWLRNVEAEIAYESDPTLRRLFGDSLSELRARLRDCESRAR